MSARPCRSKPIPLCELMRRIYDTEHPGENVQYLRHVNGSWVGVHHADHIIERTAHVTSEARSGQMARRGMMTVKALGKHGFIRETLCPRTREWLRLFLDAAEAYARQFPGSPTAVADIEDRVASVREFLRTWPWVVSRTHSAEMLTSAGPVRLSQHTGEEETHYGTTPLAAAIRMAQPILERCRDLAKEPYARSGRKQHNALARGREERHRSQSNERAPVAIAVARKWSTMKQADDFVQSKEIETEVRAWLRAHHPDIGTSHDAIYRLKKAGEILIRSLAR